VDWITDEVAISNYLEAQDAALLKQQGFRSVLSLDGTLTERHAAPFGLSEVASYRLIDGPGNDLRVFRFAIEDLKRLAASHSPVLVQCHAGRSRSAVVVAAHLMAVCGLNPENAIALVASKREINVTPALVDLLHRLETIAKHQ
jgi:protein-tyrosine phosphatase